MVRILIALSLLVHLSFVSFSQISNRTNVWYFGYYAGIDFNTTPPTPLLDGQLNIWEGCATLCDENGDLLIYTDGRYIWNRNHEVIPNANSLGGDNSSTQSGLIVPLPGSDNLIYVFSVAGGLSGVLQYAIVDMDLNGGFGGIVSKNNAILERCTEKITSILHCNNKDYWIIAHEDGNNKFKIWKLTDSGLSIVPITIAIGTPHPATSGGVIGYMKGSVQGTKLGLGVYHGSFFEVFDFNNETGELSNPIKLTHPDFYRSYGIEFSPDGSKLYLAGTQALPNLYQVNLNLPTAAEIQNSIVLIGSISGSYFGSIQNAPDGKIYIAGNRDRYLSVIHNPNELGSACNFKGAEFYLGGKDSGIGLPNHIPSFFANEDSLELIQINHHCEGKVTLQASSNLAEEITYEWLHEGSVIPNQSAAQIQVKSSGKYEVRVTSPADCELGPTFLSETIDIDLPTSLRLENIVLDHGSCNENNGSVTLMISGGISPFQYSINGGNTFGSDNLFSDLAPGVYDIVVKDNAGCTTQQSVELFPTTEPQISDLDIVNSSCGLKNGEFTVLSSQGTGSIRYSIDGQNYQMDNSFTSLSSGTYTVTIIDSLGCTDEATLFIEPSEAPGIDLVQSNPITCHQGQGALEVTGTGGAPPYQFSIEGMSFKSSGHFSDLSVGEYELVIRDSGGCTSSSYFSVTSEAPPSITDIVVSHTSCGDENGVVLIEELGGFGVRYTIDGVNFQASNRFKNLAPGLYTAIAQDLNGCEDNVDFEIENSDFPIEPSVRTTPNSCQSPNGRITIEPGEGMSLFESAMDSINFQRENTFSNLPSGTYSLWIKDENDCIIRRDIEVPGLPPLVILGIEHIPADCAKDNGSIFIIPENEIGQINTSLNGGNYVPELYYDQLAHGTHQLSLTDESGCTIDTVIIVNENECPVFIPDAFSPNGDGNNDFLMMEGFDLAFEKIKLTIFDRWGTIVYSFQSNAGGANLLLWDGSSNNGKKLGQGVYIYLIELEKDKKEIIKKGDILLIR